MSLPIFPSLPAMAWDSVKRQIWDTKVQTSGNGRRKSLCTQSYPKWEIECSYTCLDDAQIAQAAGFFGLVRGQFQPFLWFDPEDFQITKGQIGIGDGVTADFQLIRNYGGLFVEPIRDIVDGTLTVYADNNVVPVTLGKDGLVNFATPPVPGAVLTATFQYYWRVAFQNDTLEWSNFWYGFYKLNTITVVTVR